MSNFSYVVPAYYNPVSLELELNVLALYNADYDKMEEQYVDLKDKAGQFKYLSETLPADSEARRIYEKYANDLESLANDFMLRGLNQGAKKTLADLRGRYSGEIGLIVKAQAMMEEERKIRQLRALKDPSYRYAVDNLNIDDFMYGKNPNLYAISLNDLYARGVNAGKAASSRQVVAGDNGTTLGGYFRDYVQKVGYPNISEFRQNIEVIPELKAAWEGIQKEMGVDNLTGINREQAQQSILNGMADGAIYQESHNMQRNLGVLTPMEELQALKLGYKYSNGKWERDDSLLTSDESLYTNSGESLNPSPLRSKKEIDSNSIKALEYLKKGYFKTDSKGNYYLTKKGEQAYNAINNTGSVSMYSPSAGMVNVNTGSPEYSSFRIFMDSIGAGLILLPGADYISNNKVLKRKGGWGPSLRLSLGKLFNKALNGEASYDAYQSTEYITDLEKAEDRTAWETKIRRSALRDKDNSIILQPVDFNAEQGGWVKDGDPLKGEDLKDFEVAAISDSKWGLTAFITTKDNKTYRVLVLSKNINYTLANNRDIRYDEKAIYDNMLKTGKQPMLVDENGNDIDLKDVKRGDKVTIKVNSKGEVQYYNTPLTYNDKLKFKQLKEDSLILAIQGR